MSEDGDELSARGDPERFRPVLDGQPFRLPTGAGGGIRRPQISRSEQDGIGTSLRGLYDAFLVEPVPASLVGLVRRLP